MLPKKTTEIIKYKEILKIPYQNVLQDDPLQIESSDQFLTSSYNAYLLFRDINSDQTSQTGNVCSQHNSIENSLSFSLFFI